MDEIINIVGSKLTETAKVLLQNNAIPLLTIGIAQNSEVVLHVNNDMTKENVISFLQGVINTLEKQSVIQPATIISL
jgi:hypothetical protein